MRLSTKSHYGLNACYFLAEQYDVKNGMPLKKIAQLTGISEPYLEQIIILLKKADIVTSTRGARGGYYLSKPPHDIIVGDIIRALEDNLEIVGCRNSDCTAGINCKTKAVWDKVYDSINQTLDNIRLSEL